MDDIDSLRRILRQNRVIAVVGLSAEWHRPSYFAAKYMQDHGYRIIPVNPRGGELLGEPVYRTLLEVPGPVDVVDVFRPPAEAETVARDAVAIGAKVLWFQPGTHTDEAVRLAAEAGLEVVAGRCMGETHGELGLGPGPGN